MKGKSTTTGAKSLPASMRQGSSGSTAVKGQKMNTGHLTHNKPTAKGHSKKDPC